MSYFRPKRLKNHTLWRRTYLYSLCEGVPPSLRVRYKFLVWNKTAEFCMLSGKLFHSFQSATAHFSSNKVLGTAIY